MRDRGRLDAGGDVELVKDVRDVDATVLMLEFAARSKLGPRSPDAAWRGSVALSQRIKHKGLGRDAALPLVGAGALAR